MIDFLQGMTMGLAYVAPIGLQNLFVINTALTQKKSRVYITALIVFFFDLTLALACFFGVGALMHKFKLIQEIILCLGSIIVLWIGFGVFRSRDTLDNSANVNISLLQVVSSACVVTWFNPQALIDGSMMLGAFRATLGAEQAVRFITGVATASFCWFFGLSTVLSLFRASFTNKVLRNINIICGVVIMLYGVKLFVNFLQLFSIDLVL